MVARRFNSIGIAWRRCIVFAVPTVFDEANIAARGALEGKVAVATTGAGCWKPICSGPCAPSQRFLPHMLERGSGHIVNAVSYGGLLPGEPLTIPYDSWHAALAAFTEGLARQLRGTGVQVSLYSPGSTSPRVGQSTRARGVGRWLGGADQAKDGSRLLDPLVTGLIESMHHPRFLILGDPNEAPALQRRWDHFDVSQGDRREEGVSTRS